MSGSGVIDTKINLALTRLAVNQYFMNAMSRRVSTDSVDSHCGLIILYSCTGLYEKTILQP